QVYQPVRLLRIERERLLNIYVTTLLKAESGKIEVTFRWRRDVNNVRSCLIHEFFQIGKALLDGKSVVELFGHERLTVTHPNDLTFFYPLDLRGVRISDLAASHDGDLKHTVHPARRPRHTAA